MSIILECKRCGHEGDDYILEEQAVHLKASCAVCGSYIKFLSKEDKYRTPEKMAEAWRKTNGFCAFCGINPNPHVKNEYTIDHMIAQNIGGDHEPENLYISCQHCNKQKNVKTVDEYRAYLERTLNIEGHKFWFEMIDAEITQPKHIADILKDLFKKNIDTKTL